MLSRLFQDQDFKILSRPSRVFKTKTLHHKTKTFLWCILEADRKAFFISAVNENADENEIIFTTVNKTKSYLFIFARKTKITWSFSFSYIQSQSQPYNAPPIPRPVSLLQVGHVDGIPLSSCTVYRYLCGIFLDDISTREQLAFLVYCYRVKAIFHNLCIVLASVWPNKQPPFPLNWG